MKKYIFAVLFLAASLTFSACSTGADNTRNNTDIKVKTGQVTFFNESSYKVVVHQDFFSGPVLLELSAGQSKKTDVRTSDNYGVGSTFSIEYLYRINDAFDVDSGEVIASGLDPNVQINFVVEADKTYTRQIPQPQEIEFQTAFIKILNSASLQFELRNVGTALKQTGNGNLSVASGKTGVYKLEGIPAAGKQIENYHVVANFTDMPIAAFTVQNGFIYNFTCDGTSVIKNAEQSIMFNKNK